MTELKDVNKICDHLICQLMLEEEQKNFNDVMFYVDSSLWKEAIKSELDCLVKSHSGVDRFA